MRLASVFIAERPAVVAQAPGGTIVDAGALLGRADIGMDELIADAPAVLGELAEHLEQGEPVPVEQVRWRAPSPRPSKIVGVAVNNSTIARIAHRPATEPAYFLKPPSALTGHGEPIIVDRGWGLTHPEPELAAVIGRRTRAVAPEDALEAVFGFTIINDITSPGLKARDSMELVPPRAMNQDLSWRERHGEDDHSIYLTYHARSKGCDTFAPMGPWLVTRDEVDDPNRLAVNGFLGDELVVTDTTANLTFSVETVIAHLSAHMTLDPGDVVHFGTATHPNQPERYPGLWALDMSRLDEPHGVEIEGIGRLENPVGRP